MIIKNITTDLERAFYGKEDTDFENIRIDGLLDGESAFKECKNITLNNCYMNLRYPFWHNHNLKITNSELTTTCRAAIWYTTNVLVDKTNIDGIKVFRECSDIKVTDSTINSPELFWKCKNIDLFNNTLAGEYAFFSSSNIKLEKINFKGKYSFQYVENLVIKDSILDTKDAFWHTKNVTVINCIIKGEYLAWYSEGIRFINCTIIGTQPLCYAKKIIMENCKMEQADFAFEYTDVEATITTPIISIKNPHIGFIKAPQIGEVIIDEHSLKDSNFRIEN